MGKSYRIAVAGTGYVGLSIATLLSQHHEVTAVDIVPEKIEMINAKQSPIQDEYIEKYLAEKKLDLTATLDAKAAYRDADFVVIAAPTNYDSRTQHFDTSAVEKVIQIVLEVNPDAIMVIRSTIPVGYTASVREKFDSKNIIFSPEFLRESKALYDNLYPSRIIVGTDLEDEKLVKAAHEFAALLQEGAMKENVTTLFMGFTEAEACLLYTSIVQNAVVVFFQYLFVNDLIRIIVRAGSGTEKDIQRIVPLQLQIFLRNFHIFCHRAVGDRIYQKQRCHVNDDNADIKRRIFFKLFDDCHRSTPLYL